LKLRVEKDYAHADIPRYTKIQVTKNKGLCPFFKQGTNFRVYKENGPNSKDAQRGLIEGPIKKSFVCVCDC